MMFLQLPHSRRLQEQLLRHCIEAVREVREEADETDHSSSLQELQWAKRKGCDTAAWVDGVLYSMLSHTGPAGDLALLATFSVSWMVGSLPPTW